MDSKLLAIIATLALVATSGYMTLNNSGVIDATAEFAAFKVK